MDNSFRTGKNERIGFALFMGGQALFNQFINSFGQVFLTDMGIAAATVGMIFLCTRIFDAVNDPIFGGIVDRARFKRGKFIPWLHLSSLLLPLFTILLFFLPSGIPDSGKVVWASVFYVLYSISYTMCDVPIYSMVSAVTDQVQERVHIQSRNSLVSNLSMLVMVAAVPFLYPRFGWAVTALVVAVPAFILMQPMGRVAKERYINKSTEPVTLRSMFSFLRSNRYLLLFFTGLLLINATNTTMASALYFTTNNLGNAELTGVLSLLLAVPALLFAIILPKLTKRYDKFLIYFTCVMGMGVVSIVTYFVGYSNLIVLFVLTAIRGVFWGANTLMMLMFTSDFIEYGEFKTGKRLQGTAYSIQTFICKLMTAISSAVVMFVLAATGFIEGAGAVQTQTTLDATWLLFALMPALGAAMSIPILLRYKLRDKDVQLMAKANCGEITHEEAESGFTHTY